MNIDYNELKKKDVIDVCSGKKLGKVKNISFTFPDGKITGVTAGGLFCGEDSSFLFSDITRIGEDTVLVEKKKPSRQDGCCYGGGFSPSSPPPGKPSENRKARLDDDDYM